MVANPQIDRTPKKKGGKLPKIFFDIAQQEQMENVWRQRNMAVRDYTYYSASKNSWSRIDMVWATSLLRKRKGLLKWRLNEELLQEEDNLEYIQD